MIAVAAILLLWAWTGVLREAWDWRTAVLLTVLILVSWTWPLILA